MQSVDSRTNMHIDVRKIPVLEAGFIEIGYSSVTVRSLFDDVKIDFLGSIRKITVSRTICDEMSLARAAYYLDKKRTAKCNTARYLIIT